MAYIGRYVGTDKTTKTLKLDTIQSQFNGSQTVFSLRSDNVAVYPPVPQSLVISLNGVIQEPTTAYTVSADTITFSPAPATNTAFFGVLNGGQVDIGTFYAVGDATIAGRATFSNTVSVTGAVNALSTVGVTGTFSALGQLSVTGNATFDTSTLFVDATNDRVSIGATAQTAFGLTVGAYGSSTAGNRGIFAGTGVLGASGGGYGSVGYNVRYTSTSNSYSYAFTDVASLLVFDDGFTFKRAASGTGGNAITFSDFMRIDSVGTIIQQGAFSTGTEAVAIRNTSSGAVGNIARQNFYLSNSFDGGPTNSARIEAVSTNAGARDTDLRFWTASGSSAIAERMRITSGGAVGVGTTSPDRKLQLQVSPTSTGDDGIRISDGTTTPTFSLTGSAYSYRGVPANAAMIYNGGPIALLADAASTISFHANGSERMRITSGGNLAIGATARLYLDGVAGTGDTYIAEGSANIVDVNAGGASIMQVRNSGTTNVGVTCQAGGGANAGKFSNGNGTGINIVLADDATYTLPGGIAGAAIVCVYETSAGLGGAYFGTFITAMSLLAGSTEMAATDTDGKVCVFKSVNSQTMTLKNRLGGQREFNVCIFAAC